MKTIAQGFAIFPKKLLFLFAFIFTAYTTFAQAPTSLQYPTPNTFIANTTSVYLAPTLSGSATGLSYSISPALPGGLSFNTSTGVISGVPLTASTAAPYTITATNTNGSTNTSVSIGITDNYFSNAYDSIFFNITDTVKKIGNGTHVGDVILYKNVRTIGGQSIDCIVKTRSFTTGTTFTSYDQPLVTDGSTFNSNNPRFFSPQVGFPTGGGNIIFDFQFIAGGTYNNGTGAGTNVTLQDVQLNTYDIDGNGAAGSNQFNEFAGFDTSEVASATTLKSPVFDTTTVLTKYESNISTNSLIVTADATRIRLTYKNMSSFSIQVGGGAGGAAYFFLDFSTGPAFATAVKSTPPTIDLNTSVGGTENGASDCANSLSFTAASQTNAASGTPLNKLTISYTNNVANLPDGTGEQLKINGFTAGTGSFPLNFSTGGTTSVTVGGVAYTVKKSASGINDTISFYTGSTFTVANAETLLDALQYNDTVSNPTTGDRVFKVNIRNTLFTSPDAIFTASIKCVSISGNIYHDANGLTDNTVNANGAAGQFTAGQVYAVLTNAATNNVLSTVAISAGGAYSFGRTDPGNYNIFISNTATPGATVTLPTYPAGTYASTGENLGAGAGNDGLIDSRLSIVLGTIAASATNFGIEQSPTANAATATLVNPGGTATVQVPTLTGTDPEQGSFPGTGNADTVVINTLPSSGTLYYNGTAVAAGDTIKNYNPSLLTFDPPSGNGTFTFTFSEIDAAIESSTPATVTMDFTTFAVTGTVYDDANGLTDNTVNGTGTNGGGLNAVLTDAGTGKVVATTTVAADGTYILSGVDAGSYNIEITTNTATVGATPPAVALPSGYVSTGEHLGSGAGSDGTVNGILILGSISAATSNTNFGIEQLPASDAKSYNIPTPPINTTITLRGTTINPGPLSGNDPEDGTLGAAKTIIITSVPTNAELYYNGTLLADNAVINNYDTSLLQIKLTALGSVSAGFQYAFKDAAGNQSSSPANYTIMWLNPLPVVLTSFSAVKINNEALLKWTTSNELNISRFIIEHTANNGISWQEIGTVSATQNNNTIQKYFYTDMNPANGINSYRLKVVDINGTYKYSDIKRIKIEKSAVISIYPNPAISGEAVQLKLSGLQPGKYQLHVMSESGQLLHSGSINCVDGSTITSSVPGSYFSKGINIIIVKGNGIKMSKKITVLN